VLLHHYMGELDGVFRAWGFAKGGNGSVSAAIASAARAFGAEIRTNAPVERVLVEGGRAKGVVLEAGEEIRADTVVSSADPRRTFLGLLGEKHLPADFAASIKRFKFRGSSAKVNLALGELPNFTCMPGRGPHLRGAISISPSVAYIEQAYDDAKYGRVSARPLLDVRVPSVADPRVAPAGRHVMSVSMQYAPYRRRDGPWDAAARAAAGDLVVRLLAEHAPALPDVVIDRLVLAPPDLEAECGYPEGQADHAELGLDQLLFMRPVPDCARYRTPIAGLFLCGAGMHPGRRLLGAAGYLAARAALGRP
jgi:phytoene dehydrogenase-like protein